MAEFDKFKDSNWDTLLTDIVHKNDLEGRPTNIHYIFQAIQSHFSRLNQKNQVHSLTNTDVKHHLDRCVMSGHLIRYLYKKKMTYKMAQNSSRKLQFELNSQEKNEDLIDQTLLKIMIELSSEDEESHQKVIKVIKEFNHLHDPLECINSISDGLTINQMTEYLHYSHHITFSNLKDKPDTNSSKIKRVFLQSLIYSVLQKETNDGNDEKYIKFGVLYKLNPNCIPKEVVQAVQEVPKKPTKIEKIKIVSPTTTVKPTNNNINNNKNEIKSSSSPSIRKGLKNLSNNKRKKPAANANANIDLTLNKDKIIKLAFDQNSASIIVNPNPNSMFEYSNDGCNSIFYDPVNPKDKTMTFPTEDIGSQSGSFVQLGELLRSQNPQSCDGEIIVGEEVFKVHKLVLASQSNYFYNLFKDKIEGVPFLLDSAISNKLVFLLTLNFFYYGHFGDLPVYLNADSICEFLYLADKFEIPRLTEYCLETVKRRLYAAVDADFYTRLIELMFDKSPVTQSFFNSIIDIVKPSYQSNKKRNKMQTKKWERFLLNPVYEEIAQILNS